MRTFAHVLLNVIFTVIAHVTLSQEAPAHSKTTFSEEALAQPLFDLDGKSISAAEILRLNQGKMVLLYVWATWCPDCLEGFPALKELQKANPDLHVVYFSLDREEERWKEGIKKFDLRGEHYWFNTEWKNDFNNYIDLNWIPRYLLLDGTGKIAKYYSIKAEDPELQAAINALREQNTSKTK